VGLDRRAVFALVLVACSRRSAPAPGVPAAPPVGVGELDAPAPGAARAIALPPVVVGDYPPPEVDMAPGELPSQAFPAGTVYVARSEDDGLQVTEWDLAGRARRRGAKLPLPDRYARVRLLRSGAALHAVAWVFEGDLAYVRLTDDLRVVSSQRLGTVSATGPMGLASDGPFTILLADGIPGAPDPAGIAARGTYAASFDEAGRLVAARVLRNDADNGPSAGLKDSAVVAEGRAFVLLRNASASALELLRVDRHLSVEQRTTVRAPEVYAGGARVPAFDTIGVTLSSRGDRLFVDAPGAPAAVELSLRGTETRPGPGSLRASVCSGRSTEGRSVDHDVWLGAEHVTLSYGAREGNAVDLTLRWTDASGDDASLASCPDAIDQERDATSSGGDR
jgi:hypothetical protein